jgi:hypothetical protein
MKNKQDIVQFRHIGNKEIDKVHSKYTINYFWV